MVNKLKGSLRGWKGYIEILSCWEMRTVRAGWDER